jgi:hypothetical protein
MTGERLEAAVAVDGETVDTTVAVKTQPVQGGEPGRARPSVRRSYHPVRSARRGIEGIVAVGVKELRGRVRGRRAFVVLTFYLLSSRSGPTRRARRSRAVRPRSPRRSSGRRSSGRSS